MPATTPIYGFPYPCLNEVVSPTAFTALGNAVDAKLLEVQADANYATGRYNIARNGGSQAGIVVAVETALTNPNAQYVVPVSGVYLTTIDVEIVAVTSMTANRLRVRLNGTPVYGRTTNTETAPFRYQVPPAPIVAAAGDTISCSFLYQGTGTATVAIYIASRLIVRIA